MDTAMPLAHSRQRKPVSHRCGACGDRKCRKKWKAVCWTNCAAWKPEALSLEDLPGMEWGTADDE